MGTPQLPVNRRQRWPLKKGAPPPRAVPEIRNNTSTLDVPKYVPVNTFVPGTIALTFFTFRGLRRP